MVSKLRAKILNQKDIKTATVEIPEWIDEETKKPIVVAVKSLSAYDRALVLEASLDDFGKTSMVKLYPSVIQKCAIDPDSAEPIFTDEDVMAMMDHNPVAMDHIFAKALELSGMQQGAVAEARKN